MPKKTKQNNKSIVKPTAESKITLENIKYIKMLEQQRAVLNKLIESGYKEHQIKNNIGQSDSETNI